MVTLVSRLPFHQPASSCKGQQVVAGAPVVRRARSSTGPATRERRNSPIPPRHEQGGRPQCLGHGAGGAGSAGEAASRPAGRAGRPRSPPSAATRPLDEIGHRGQRRLVVHAVRLDGWKYSSASRAPASVPEFSAATTGSDFFLAAQVGQRGLAGHVRAYPRCRAGRPRTGTPGPRWSPNSASAATVAASARRPRSRRSRTRSASAHRSCRPPWPGTSGSVTSVRRSNSTSALCPTISCLHGLVQAADHVTGQVGPAVPASDLDGQGEQRVAGQDRGRHAEHRPRGRPVPAFHVVVHDVVVQQREVVHQLHGDGGRQRQRRVTAGRLRGQQGQRGPQRLAAAARRVPARPRRPTRSGSAKSCASQGASSSTARRSAGSTTSRAAVTSFGSTAVMMLPPQQ